MTQPASSATERSKVGMLVPPPLLWLGLAVASSVAQLAWLGPFATSPWRMALGLPLVAAAVALLASSSRAFKREGTPVRPTSPAVAVVIAGPYRFSRNPMYLGMAGLLLGCAVLGGSVPFAIAAIVFVAVVHVGVVLPEERYMESLHGEAYRAFKARVRRWL